LSDASKKPDEPTEFQWDLWAWFRGSPAQNVIVLEPDEIGDYATYEKTGKAPLKGGIQFAQYPPMKGRQCAKQWLSGRDTAKNGDLRVVHLDEALDYVCGEVHRAYAYLKPALWVRHVLFVKPQKDGPPPYALICDEMEADAQPRTFAWQLHARLPFSRDGRRLSVNGKSGQLDVHLLSPSDGPVVEKETPAPLEKERSRFIQWRTVAPQPRCAYLAALQPRDKAATAPPPTFRVVEATGGWAIEVKADGATDLALFRSERAPSVSADGVSAAGTAALLRKRPNQPALLFVLGAERT